MGLLTIGQPLSWDETKELSNHVRDHGINQFINLYRQVANRSGDAFKWGDEIEYMLIKFDDEKKEARVWLHAHKLLSVLNEITINNPTDVKSLWSPEYGAFMIEGSPGQPYNGLLADIKLIETNMKYRRQQITDLLPDDVAVMTTSNFPRLGASNFTWPNYKPQPNNINNSSGSVFIPDEVICPIYARYHLLTRNIRQRRGQKIDIRIPIFKDKNTQIPVDGAPADQPNVVYMDSLGFGGGCCCIQFTYQAMNESEARILYDQLAVLCPIMLALTAATPVFRGYLVDSDCRWNVLRDATDSRTPEERNEKPLRENQFRIPKYSFDSIDSYISDDADRYNDMPMVYNEQVYGKLRNGNVDHLMAQHIAQLFIRDPIVLFRENIDQCDEVDTNHLENILSTNWRSMRLKPPVPHANMGWRVEFRPCEIQLSDFENAAIACFVTLLTRVILFYDLNFLIPISKVSKNMETAQTRNACQYEGFWFRKNVFDKITRKHDEYERMTIDQIVNGNGSTFPGLIPLMQTYMFSMNTDTDTNIVIQRYLQFIQRKASGDLLTTASWIRQEITNHPEYKKDSVVTERINYDLLKKIEQLQNGTQSIDDLFGSSTCNSKDSSDIDI